ncbi:MAG: hypothetical protein M3348_16385 [Acidobacteriota bacterium]|nr:hypothetical protein [Acidobacteriota bacterium]
MSGTRAHPGDGRGQRLSLYAFRIVPVKLLTGSRILIRDLLFGPAAASKDAVFEMNPVSGYFGYRHTKKLYREEKRDNLSLAPTEAEATRAAKAFLAERHLTFKSTVMLQQAFADTLTPGKPLLYPFSPIPPPQWLKHAGTYLVRNDKHEQPDHWLCKFQAEVETPDGKKLPVHSSSIDLRLGESAGGVGPLAQYEVIGFRSRWRPVYEHYRVEQFLPDTGEPGHDPPEAESTGQVHLGETTLLAYMLSDENVPQHNLLPYEATVSGEHHMSVLPASKDSLWVEMRVSRAEGKYKIQALVLGGSGNFKAQWGFWNPFGFEPPGWEEATKKKEPEEQQALT